MIYPDDEEYDEDEDEGYDPNGGIWNKAPNGEWVKVKKTYGERLIESMGWTKKTAKPPRVPTPGYVYVLEMFVGYKIGCTTNLERRMKAFETHMPFKPTYAHLIKTNDIYELEAILHRCYKDVQINSEWYNLSELDVRMLRRLYPMEELRG